MKPFTENDYFMYGSLVAHRVLTDIILIRLLGSISFLSGCGKDFVLWSAEWKEMSAEDSSLLKAVY